MERQSFLLRWWFRPRLRAIVIQAVVGLAVVLALAGMGLTARENLARVNLGIGFDFLAQPSSVQAGETLVPQQPSDSYLWLLVAAAVNTLRVVLIASLLATVLGLLVALARLSRNPLPRAIATGYVALCRGTPVLLQILVWYAIMQTLPPIRQALSIGQSIFLSQRGLVIPAPVLASPGLAIAGLMLLAVALVVVLARLRLPRGTAAVAALAGLGLAIAGFQLDFPIRRAFNYAGGLTLSPEFAALLCGLVFYSTAYMAEVIRGGILSLPRGQWEAARALGLRSRHTFWLVVLPQALRVVIPPMTVQYLSLLKNSTLAFAIGYPDLFWAINTMINQTGHAVEGIMILMAVFLVPSLTAAGLLNALNKRIARQGLA